MGIDAWKKQKYLQSIGIPSIETIINIAREIENTRTRALFVLLYLTAGRIGEIVRKKNNNIILPSIKRKDLQVVNEEGRYILLIRMRNEKHRTRKIKEIPIPLDREENRILINLAKPHIDRFALNQELFPISIRYARELLKDICNPHWLRHVRATHLVTIYNFNEQQLKIYLGWTDTRHASRYVEMRWSDLLSKL